MRQFLNRVTVTGADESIDPIQLRMIQEDYPFVEWGILVSEHKTMKGGCARFPPPRWLAKLDPTLGLSLSVHLCGSWVRRVCQADFSWLTKPENYGIALLITEADRVQLNFHSYVHKIKDVRELAKQLNVWWPHAQIICQVDGVNDEIVSHLHDEGANVAALYDKSGGAGKLPAAWKHPLKGIYCGYAGGLSPENVMDQLDEIGKVAEAPSWIDAETHLRAEDDRRFAVEKVMKFIAGAALWVKDAD